MVRPQAKFKTVLSVAERQQRRHKVFRWYYEKWGRGGQVSWADFRAQTKSEFEKAFPKLTIPTAGTTLAKNLQFVLDNVCVQGVPLIDVLLFSTLHNNIHPETIEPCDFRLVVMYAKSIGGDGFIEL